MQFQQNILWKPGHGCPQSQQKLTQHRGKLWYLLLNMYTSLRGLLYFQVVASFSHFIFQIFFLSFHYFKFFFHWQTTQWFRFLISQLVLLDFSICFEVFLISFILSFHLTRKSFPSSLCEKLTKWVGKAAALVVIIAELRLRISMSRHVHNTTQHPLPPLYPSSPLIHMWSTARCETFVWELICELLSSVHSDSESGSASDSQSESESQSESQSEYECESVCEWPVWIEGNWMLSNMWMTFAVGRPLNVS